MLKRFKDMDGSSKINEFEPLKNLLNLRLSGKNKR